MTLGDLIDELRKHDPAKRVPDGFARPHSYRGYYECLAFEPAKGVTVGSMLEAAVSADGATYQGYKGGDFRMGKYTDVYLAEYGYTGEPLGLLTLRAMLNPVEDAVRAAVAAERAWAAGVVLSMPVSLRTDATTTEAVVAMSDLLRQAAAAIRRGPEPTEGV